MSDPQPLDLPAEVPLSQIYWDGPDLIVGPVRLKEAKIESYHTSVSPDSGKQVVTEQWQGLGEDLDLRQSISQSDKPVRSLFRNWQNLGQKPGDQA